MESTARPVVEPQPTNAVMQTIVSNELTIFPHVIEFRDVQAGRTYTTLLRIQNSALRARRIRILCANSSNFRVKFANDLPVAPGIEVTCEVSYICTDGAESAVVDSLLVRADDTPAVKVPLHAFPPMPLLQLSSNALHFGNLVLGSTASGKVTVTNDSLTREAVVNVTVQGENKDLLTVSPSNFRLLAASQNKYATGHYADLLFEFRTAAADEGMHKFTVVVETAGNIPRIIEVTAKVSEHIVQMSEKATGEALLLSRPLDIGALFFGEDREREVLLENDGPAPISFCFSVTDGIPDASNAAPNDDAASASTHGSVITAHAALAAKKDSMGLVNASVTAALARITSVNNPPLNKPSTAGNRNPLSFATISANGSLGSGRHVEPAEVPPSMHFTVTPREGVVQPFSKFVLKVKFKPIETSAPPAFKQQADSALEASRQLSGTTSSKTFAKSGKLDSLAGSTSNNSKTNNMLTRLMSKGTVTSGGSGPVPKLRIPSLESPTRAHGQYYASKDEFGQNMSTMAATVSGDERPRSRGSLSPARQKEEFTKFREFASTRAHTLKEQSGYEIACESSTPALPAETFAATITAKIEELDLDLPLIVFGVAERPLMHLSARNVNFGAVHVNDRRDYELVVTSHTRSLPMVVGMGKVAGIFSEPRNAIVNPGESQRYILSMMPTRLGSIVDTLPVYAFSCSRPLEAEAVYSAASEAPPRKTRVHDPAAAVEELREIHTAALDIVPLHIEADAVAANASLDEKPVTPLTPFEILHFPMQEVVSIAAGGGDRGGDRSGTRSRSPLLTARSGKRERTANAPTEVFEPERKFIEGIQPIIATRAVSPAKLVPAWAKVAAKRDLGAADITSDPKYTYTLGDLRAKQIHDAAYDDYVRQARAYRKSLAADGTVQVEDERMIGMAETKVDMRPPVLDAPNKAKALAEPVWLARPTNAEGKPKPRSGGNSYKFNQDKLIKVKYKEAPSTQAEMTDCTTQLSDDELTRIVAGPHSLDFGTFNVRTPVVKNLTFVNDHDHSVRIELAIDESMNPELMRTSPKSQVVPSGAIAGFDITYYTEQDLSAFGRNGSGGGFNFTGKLTYVINGKHKSFINLSALIFPIELELPRSDMYLRFAEGSLDKSVTHNVELRNTGTAVATYRWENFVSSASAMATSLVANELLNKAASRQATTTSRANSSHSTARRGGATARKESTASVSQLTEYDPSICQFELRPLSGSIAPGQSVQVGAVYTPSAGGRPKESYRLIVDGGPQGDRAPLLTLIGELQDGVLQLSEKLIDFGKIGVGVRRDLTLTVQNVGSTPAVFWLAAEAPPGISVSPAAGRLDPGESCEIAARLDAIKPMKLDPELHSVSLQVRGGRIFSVPVAATVIMPDVSISEPMIDFGGVTLGSFRRKRLTILNLSAIYTDICIDLTDYPDFYVAPPSLFSGERDDVSIGDESMFQADSIGSAGGDEKAKPGAGGKKSASTSNKNSVAKFVGDDEEEEEEDDPDEQKEAESMEDARFANLPRKLRVKLNPSGALPFEFVFRPTSAKPYSFKLPLALVGMVNAPNAIQRQVDAVGLAPRISLDPGAVLDFEYRVFAGSDVRRVPYTMNFKMRNVDPLRPVVWRADTTNLIPAFGGMKQVFALVPDRGTIPIGETVIVRVSFDPAVAPKDFVNTVPIYVLEDVTQEAALELQLRTANTESDFSPRGGRTPRRSSRVEAFQDAAVGLQPYIDLELRGSSINRQLSFDVREVVLPAVPLGVEARATFHVISNGYDHLELRHAIGMAAAKSDGSEDKPSPVALSLSYPQGNILSLSRLRLPVVLSFKSATSLSATAFVHFQDQTGQKFSLPVSFCTDNSVLSVHTYLETKCAELAYEGPGEEATGPVRVVALQSSSSTSRPSSVPAKSAKSSTSRPSTALTLGLEKNTLPYYASVPAHASISCLSVSSQATSSVNPVTVAYPFAGPATAQLSPANVSVLVRSLNSMVFRSPIVNFPGDIIAAHCKPVLDAIEALCNQAVPGRIKSRIPAGKKERAIMLYNQSRDLLAFLRAHGAMISGIRPESLLSKDDFMQVRKYQHKGYFGPAWGGNVLQYLSPAVRKHRNKLLGTLHPLLSMDAWCNLMLQVVRLYLLPRVNLRTLVTLSGMVLSAATEEAIRFLSLREAALDAALHITDDKREISAEAIENSKAPSTRQALNAAADAIIGGATDQEGFAGALSPRSLGAATPTGSVGKTFDFAGPPGAEGSVPSLHKDESRAAASLRGAVMASGVAKRRAGSRPTGSIADSLPHNPEDIGFQVYDAVARAAGSNIPADVNQILLEKARVQRLLAQVLAGDGGLGNSNVYSQYELVLLRWLSYHRNRGSAVAVSLSKRTLDAVVVPEGQPAPINPCSYEHKKMVCFDTDFADCTAWINVLLSHSPELGLKGRVLDFTSGKVYQQPKNNKQIRENAIAFVAALKEMKLDAPFSADDLCPEISTDIMNALGATRMAMSARAEPDFSIDFQGLFAAADQIARQPQCRALEFTEPDMLPTCLFTSPSVVPVIRQPAATIQDTNSANTSTAGMDIPVPKFPVVLSNVFTPRQGLLWSLWLFHNLPQLVPKTIVDFEGPANSRITRSLTLHNPTEKPMLYDVTLEGSTDFTLPAPSVRIEPGSTVQYAVSCIPRFAYPVHAKISFRTRREGTTPVQSLVFALRSAVIARPPASVKDVTSRCYQSNVFDVEVRNIFGKDAVFDVVIIPLAPTSDLGQNVPPWHRNALQSTSPSPYVVPAVAAVAALQEPVSLNSLPMVAFPPPVLLHDAMSLQQETELSLKEKKERASKTPTATAKAAVSQPPQDAMQLTPPDFSLQPFWCRYTRVTLKAGQSKRLPVQFAPLRLGDNRATLVMTDINKEIGELTVELVGRATQPVPLARFIDRVPFTGGGDKSIVITRLFAVPALNAQLEGAEESMVDRYERAVRQEFTRQRDVKRATGVVARFRSLNLIRTFGICSTRAGRVRGGSVTNGVLDSAVAQYVKVGDDGKAQGVLTKAIPSLIGQIGKFFSVECDSPFFQLPPCVFVPGPLFPLTATQVTASDSGSTRGNTYGAGASVSNPATPADLGASRAGKTASAGTAAMTARAIAEEAGDQRVARAIRRETLDQLTNVLAELKPPVETEKLLEAARLKVPADVLACMMNAAIISPSAVGTPRTFQAVCAQIAANTLGVPTNKASVEMAAQLVEGVPELTAPTSVAETLAFSDDDILPLLSKLPITINVAKPGVYMTRLTLTCEDDIRVYDIEIAVEAPSNTPSLTFTTAAMHPCVQLLPIYNTTMNDWILNSKVEERSSVSAGTSYGVGATGIAPAGWRNTTGRAGVQHFICPPRIVIPAQQSFNMPITFAPPYEGVESVSLRLLHDTVEEGKMTKTLQTPDASRGQSRPVGTSASHGDSESVVLGAPPLQYELTGRATAPASSGSIAIKVCTGQFTSQTVQVSNFDTVPASFTVESSFDLFEGPKTVNVPAAAGMAFNTQSRPELMTFHASPVLEARESLQSHSVAGSADSRVMSALPSPIGTPSAGSPVASRRASTVEPTLFRPGTATYNFRIASSFSGISQGHIGFRSAEGQYQWFAVTIDSKPPEPIAEIPLTTVIRRAVRADLDLTNPTNAPQHFNVEILGDGLLGEPEVVVPPNSTIPFELLYAPLVASPLKRGSSDEYDIMPGLVRFFNPQLGEVSYAVHMTALPAPPIDLPPFVTPAGATHYRNYSINNPTSETVVLSVESSDPDRFFVSDSTELHSTASVALPPCASTQVYICYMPDTIDFDDYGHVFLVSDVLGEWAFEVSGKGAPPEDAPLKLTYTEVGTTSSSHIVFRNPLNTPLRAMPYLEVRGGTSFAATFEREKPAPQEKSKVSGLRSSVSKALASPSTRAASHAATAGPIVLLDPKAVDVAAQGVIHIPYAFTPNSLAELHATIVVEGLLESGRVTLWRFPLKCCGDAPVYDRITSIACPVAEIKTVALAFPLTQLNFPQGIDKMTCSMEVLPRKGSDPQVRAALSKFVILLATKVVLTRASPSIELEIEVTPLRTISFEADLVVTVDKVEGRWRFPLEFIFSQPKPTATVYVEATVGSAGSAQIPCGYVLDVATEYRAYFTLDSPLEFTVSPEKGVLWPHSGNTGITVHFSPREYGKPYAGRLIFETADFEWHYDVQGRLPQYIPPRTTIPISSSLSTRSSIRR